MRTITFNELRKIKDSLPEGSIHRIAESLHLTEETVRNYFGGANYKFGQTVGIHLEKGPSGGVVELDDTTILDMAISMLKDKS
jgi:predicted transcriptional regulator